MNAPFHSPACTPERVLDLCSELGFSFARETGESLCRYLLLLEKWNRVMNLVGKARWQDVLGQLVADSFHLAGFLGELPLPPAPECWDLGSGAGLPGLPLRMLWQAGRYTLVEAREKRALFLRTALIADPLPGVSVFQGRVENFLPTRPLADVVVSRAVMPWPKVLELVGPRMAPGGRCVFLVLQPLPDALPRGWTAEAGKQYSLAGDTRYFWSLMYANNAEH
jgi:16S rRNA (guanine527-N7)-methyltransferase